MGLSCWSCHHVRLAATGWHCALRNRPAINRCPGFTYEPGADEGERNA